MGKDYISWKQNVQEASVDGQALVTDSSVHSKQKKSNWWLLVACACLYYDQVADLHGYYNQVLLSDRDGFFLKRGEDNSSTVFNITAKITSYIFA